MRLGIDNRAEEREAHSFYLELLAQMGLMGATAYALILFMLFRGLWRAKRRLMMIDRTDLIPWITSIQLALIGYHVTSIFLHGAFIRYLWLLVAIAASSTVAVSGLVQQYHLKRSEGESHPIFFKREMFRIEGNL